MITIDSDLIREMAEKGVRIDNRKFDLYRKIKIEKGVISSAEGSARVEIGNTKVIAGIKMDIGEPYSDTPDEGVMSVGAEFVPLASPEFESGPPGAAAIELARVVDRAIRESKCIDFKKLAIDKEHVWMVFVDIDILDDDGNLIDASGLAAIAALMNARIPEIGEEFKINYEKKTKPLPIEGIPVSTTVAKIDGKLLVDPCLVEFEALDSRLTVGTVEKKDGVYMCSMQKGGSTGLTLEEIDEMIALAIEKGNELRELLK
ncbi:MAG: exosome complex protein Rrp42 [Candidatus Aenigmatarchaeota archaeon]